MSAAPARAVLLRAIDYRDADRILTFYTRERGRLSAVARGARRSRKRFGGALEPFCEVQLVFGRGRGDLATLKEATVTRAFPRMLGALGAMREGGAALDLLRRITRDEDPEPRLFDATLELFGHLGEAGKDEVADLRLAFTVRALSLVGMAPELETCALSGVRCPPGQSAYFDATRGSIVRHSLGGQGILLSGEARRRLTEARGSGWGTVRFGGEHHPPAARAMERFVAAHVP